MHKIFTLIFLILTAWPIGVAHAEPEVQAPSASAFSEKFNAALEASNQGNLYVAYAMFEDLLIKHPGEFLVYEAYATVAESHGNDRRALKIYKKWIAIHGTESGGPLSVTEKILAIEKRIETEKIMNQAPPWEKAKAFGNQIVTFMTNVPEPQASVMAKEILDLIEEDRRILEKIFGYPLPEERPLKVYLAARAEEYGHLAIEKSKQRGISSAAFYIPDQQEIVISSVAMTRAALAHELAHHLIHAYIQNPSTLISEGLAGYLEMKLGKETAKAQWLEYLETLNYLYDQGQWEHFLRVIPVWQAFLSNYRAYPKRFGSMRRNFYGMFYMHAWAAVHFFAETEDPFFSGFFRDYLEYERKQEFNTWQTFQEYFTSHLTEVQMTALDDQWSRHTVNLTYDNI